MCRPIHGLWNHPKWSCIGYNQSMPTKIEISPDLCIQCGACVQVCPAEVFTHADTSLPPLVARPQRCIACGHCVAVCPEDAIIHSRFPASALFPVNVQNQPDGTAILKMMQTRRSVREFTRQQVSKEKMQLVLKAARSAPIASNRPTTRYTIVQSADILSQVVELTVFHFANQAVRLRNPFLRMVGKFFKPGLVKMGMAYLPVFDEMLEKLKQGNDPILHHAPTLMLFHGPNNRKFANENAQLACQNAALMCHSIGLGAFYTGYVIMVTDENPAIARLLQIQERETIFAGLAIGFPSIVYQKGIHHPTPSVQWK